LKSLETISTLRLLQTLTLKQHEFNSELFQVPQKVRDSKPLKKTGLLHFNIKLKYSELVIFFLFCNSLCHCKVEWTIWFDASYLKKKNIFLSEVYLLKVLFFLKTGYLSMSGLLGRKGFFLPSAVWIPNLDWCL
jgi:hypothetical protein